MFNPAAYENSRADGIGVLTVRPEEAGAPPQFVPLKRTELGGEIVGPLAAMRLAQAYGYSAEQCDKTLEALYRFPLPGDAGRVLRLADEEAARPERRRISVICIDAAPNAFLANELAERGGGVARFLSSSPEEGDVTTALDEVLADWSEPILANLRLEINRPGAETTGRTVLEGSQHGWSVIDLGDLPAGRAIWVAGRVPRGESNELRFRVVSAEGREVASTTIPLDAATSEMPALKALFGARRVLGLEFLITSGYSGEQLHDQLRRLGYDPDQALAAPVESKLYAENVRQDAQDALKDLLVREALDYGLASSETAFVAVRREAGKPLDGTIAVANALPSGWSDEFASGGARVMASRAGAMRSGTASFAAARLSQSPMEVEESPLSPAELALRRALERLAASFFDEDMDPAAGMILQRELERLRLASFNEGADLTALTMEATELAEKKWEKPHPFRYHGTPAFSNGEAVLIDSARPEDEARLPDHATISGLSLRFPEGTPDAQRLDPELALHLFLDDLSVPRARVRLADLVRQGGQRPLHLRRQPGQRLRLVLVDPNGAWAGGAPALELELDW